ncbi:MAG TPA: type II secretion system F family protein [Candidatus Paceibacterota bacterium]
MKFHFKAERSNGEIFEGDKEAPDKFALFDEIKKEGATMLFAHEAAHPRNFFGWRTIVQRFVFGSIPLHQKIIFAKNVAAMIEAGLPLSRALSVIERQIGNAGMKKIIAEVNESIKKGLSFSDSLAKFPGVFSSLFVSIVRSGEEGGNLPEALRIITGQLERIYFIQRKVRGALMYPAVIISLIILVGILMFIFVVPKLTSTFTELKVTLPLSTQIIISTSTFLKDHIFISLGAVLGVIFLVWMAIKTPRGERIFDFISIKFPLIGPMVKETNTARAARTLSSLLASGVNVVEALQITNDVVQNYYFKEVLRKAKESIQKGSPLSTPFSENDQIYPAFFGEMVAAGEETGNLSSMLSDVATFYENEVDEMTKNFSTIIEPLIMIVIGGAVGFFAYAMLTPMYSMMGAIS